MVEMQEDKRYQLSHGKTLVLCAKGMTMELEDIEFGDGVKRRVILNKDDAVFIYLSLTEWLTPAEIDAFVEDWRASVTD